ncbi:MAG: VWA domain-containing protein, partial [Acidobacteriaceae bacterium]|nr:VWA domain-containing protein [Acidobacteriaceae bacterium]
MRLKRVACAAFLASFGSALLIAQFHADTRLVVLHASVTDRKGKLLTNLDRDAFRVYENGQPQEVKIFRREDVPVSLGIIIDDSGSMSTKRSRVEAAALAMVRASNPQDEVFIVNFNDDAYLDVPFTNDMRKMEQGLARIDSRGGTAMRDAINMSLDYMKQEAKKDKKVLLVITDGNDNASNISLERVVQRS